MGQWASYRAKGCVDGHCVQLGALAWGWPPAWQPLPFWPRPRAVARWPSPPCAQLQLSARQPQPNRRQAALAGLHAVLRWRLRRGPSTCRHLSLTPGTITLSRRAVLRVDQLEQFLHALGKQRSVCSVSEVGCRMELSCAPKARIHVLQAPALMTTSLTPQGSERLCLALRQCSSVTAAASLVSSHLEECHIATSAWHLGLSNDRHHDAPPPPPPSELPPDDDDEDGAS